MTFILKALLAVLKSILLTIASETLMKWVILELAELAAKSTATKFDDELVERIKDALNSDVHKAMEQEGK